jgi:GNAT superfamily N-acetyltransferase
MKGEQVAGESARTGVRIREAVVEDAPLILALIRELAEYERIADQVAADEETLRRTLFGEGAVPRAIIAEVDGEPVGFAVYFYNFSTFVGRPGLYIEDIYIRPAHRGSGAGRAMMRHCARVAERKGCGRIEMAVLDWNPARSFYERLGAAAMPDWVIYRLQGGAIRRLAGD